MRMRDRLRLHHEGQGIDEARCPICNPVQPRRRQKRRARWAGWIAAWRAGTPVGRIAREAGVTDTAVHNALIRSGARERGRQREPNSPEKIAAAIAMYEAGATLEQIGAHYGVTRERVRQWFAKVGKGDLAQQRFAAHREARSRRTCARCGQVYEAARWAEHFARGTHKELRAGSKMDPARWDGVAADYAAGMKVSAISAKWDMEITSIMRTVRAHGIPLRAPHMGRKGSNAETAARKARIRWLLASGLTAPQVAADVGCSAKWVYMVSKEARDGR